MKTPAFAVVIERAGRDYGAYVPDLPGCAVVGRSRREVQSSIRKAMTMYLEDMIAEGEPIPRPAARIVYVPQPKLRRRKAAP